jgi:hypothetical protein
MGDKISQLPVATTVDGTELVPIVQGGATKQVTGAILRSPVGVAGGDLTGTFPNPTLASVTTAQTGVGSGSAIPVLTVDAKGRVISLSTTANPALTTNQIAGLSTAAGAALATTGVVGLSTFAARADHQHARPTPAEIGALGATASAGGDLTGNFPNPTLAAVTTAQTNVGSGTQIPVLSVDAKGRITGLSSVPVSASTTAISSLTSDVIAVGPGAASASLAAITTAQSNVGSGTSVPVLSIDAKGRVTALGSTPISGSAGGTVTSITAGTGLSGGTITGSGTIAIANVTAAQSNVGSASQVPVLSINAQGQVTALSTVAIATSSGAPLTTTAPAALASVAAAGISSEAARADHQHVFPTAAQVGALGATAAASGDLTGNYPGPTLAAITTAQSNVGSASAIPVVSIDAKGRVTSLATVGFSALTTAQIAGLSTTAPAALSASAVIGVSTFAARADHQHVYPTAAQVGALGATAAAGGDLTGNYPSPTLAAITTAQSNVGSASVIPVVSVDAKGRVTALSTIAFSALTTSQIAGLATTTPAALATTGVVGLSTFAARADHQHIFPTAAEVGALGATAAASGDLTGNYPGPTLAAITTAQTNVGSSSVIPVLSIDAKGRVTSLTTAAAAPFTVAAVQTQSLTIDATFAQKFVPFQATGSTNVTLPADAGATITPGTELKIMNLSTAPVYLLAGSGATVNSLNGMRALVGQYSSATASKIAANTWLASGNMAAGSDTDPYFTNVSVLLHMNGANGGTSFPDNSINNYTVTRTGNPTTSTAQFKFGSASYLGVSGGYLTINSDNTPFAFGVDDFTIEFWARPTSFGAQQNVILISPIANSALIFNSFGNVIYQLNNTNRITSSAAIGLNIWTHIAICRAVGQTRMFINGVVQPTVYTDSTNFPSTGALWQFGGDAAPLLGYADDFRVTKGVGRYVASFNPPIAEFPDA